MRCPVANSRLDFPQGGTLDAQVLSLSRNIRDTSYCKVKTEIAVTGRLYLVLALLSFVVLGSSGFRYALGSTTINRFSVLGNCRSLAGGI